jgi:hypothetical protein
VGDERDEPRQPRPPSPPPPGAWAPPPGWGQPAYQFGYAAPTKTNTTAVVAFVLALASFGLCPFVGAIAALVLASIAQREIDASNGAQTGPGLVTAARVLAVVHFVFFALWLLSVIAG